MKKISKFLSVILTLIMVISIIPMSAITSNAYVDSGTCGDNVTWTYNTSTYTLTISGTGAMHDYDDVNRPCWESYEDSIMKVVISNGVTTIGDWAFAYCYNLTSVTIGDSVTTIGESAFAGCENLTNIIIPDSVTTIGYGAFSDCTNLTSVTIPDSVTTISGYAFHNCSNLTSVTIGDSVTTIGDSAFGYCTILTSVTIPDSVTTIGDRAFYYCIGLTSITVDNKNKFYSCDEYGVLFNKDKTTLIQYPVGNTRVSYSIPDSVTTIGAGSFYGCPNLESVTIGAGVTTIGKYAFSWCGSLASVTIPDNVTTIGNSAFYYCKSLTSVTIGDNVTTIGDDAFYYCISLTSVTIPDSVTAIGNSAFYYCDSLTSITVDDNNKYYSNDEYGVLFNKDKTTLIQYPIGNTRANYTIPNSVTTIGYGAFSDCTNLTSVTIPDSVTTISGYAFHNCSNLTSVTIGDSVTTIGDSTFAHCTNLTSITIPVSVTTIGWLAFNECSLTDVYYGGTEAQWNKIFIWWNNEELTSATIHYNSTGPHTHYYESVVTSPTCTGIGYTSYTCECGDSYVDDYVNAKGHDYKIIIIKDATCTEKGSRERQCARCGDVSTLVIEPKGHTYSEVVTPPTCIKDGYTTYTCECGDTYMKNMIPATGHEDLDVDAYCDHCDELLCDHDCHRGGIVGFFWKITNFFNKIFGSNKICDCGVAHY